LKEVYRGAGPGAAVQFTVRVRLVVFVKVVDVAVDVMVPV
jgi:hypothetical protein